MRKLLIGGAIGALAVCARWPSRAFTAFGGSDGDSEAAQSVRRVGLMHVGTDHIPPALEPLKARLAELGWTEGKNIELIFRNLEPEQAAGQAKVFVAQRVDVIVAFEDQSIDAAAGGNQHWEESDSGRLPPSLRSTPRRPGQEPVPSGRKHDGGLRPARCRRQAAGGLPGPRAGAASSAHARRPDGQEDGAAAEGVQEPPPRSCNDRSSWTSGKPRPQRISSGSSARCAPERSTAHSSCRTTSGRTTRR